MMTSDGVDELVRLFNIELDTVHEEKSRPSFGKSTTHTDYHFAVDLYEEELKALRDSITFAKIIHDAEGVPRL